jgi:hypothetical protein
MCYVLAGDTVVRTGSGVYGTQGHGDGGHVDQLSQAGLAHLLTTLLQRTPVQAGELPVASSASTPQPVTPTTAAVQRGATAGLNLPVQGRDALDELDYYVFPTDESAAGYLQDRGQSTDANLSSLGLPYACVSFQSSTANTGQSDCYVQAGNVIVRSVTQVSGTPSRGNQQLAGQLATAGVQHVQRITRGS